MDVDKAILAALNQPDKPVKDLDEEDHFGCMVAQTVRLLPPAVRALTKLKIHQALVEAELSIGTENFYPSIPAASCYEELSNN